MKRGRGFTLVEMLVVLVITGLLVGLVFDALYVFRRANDRVSERTLAGRDAALAGAWFADSVAGLRAVAGQSAAPPFEGAADAFAGTTTLAISGGAGVPARVRWSLDAGAGTLSYRQGEPAGPVEVFAAPQGAVRFAYHDGAGRWHDRWPPALGLAPALPAAVALVVVAEGREVLRPTAVLGPRDAVEAPFEGEME